MELNMKNYDMVHKLQVPVLYNITISPNTNSISIGHNAYIFATCIDQYGNTMTCPTITWISNNPSVATVYNQSGEGIVTAIAVGTVNIIATSLGVTSNISTLTISSPILTKIGIYPSNPTVVMGQTKQFGIGCYDQYDYSMTCPTIIWDTTDHTLGTITSTGLFTANAPSGTVMVMATAGAIVENILVTLYIPTLASIEIPHNSSMYIGDLEHIYARCIDQYGNRMTCPTITWTSSNPSVATVDQIGVVTGIAAGTTNITAIAAGIPSNMVVIVSTPILSAIVLEPISASINVGSTLQLTKICSYNTGATMTCPVSWSSDNMSVAIVDSSGLVTGVSSGSANITASSSGTTSNVSAITIIPTLLPECTSIGLIADKMFVYVGDNVTFTVTTQPLMQQYPIEIRDQNNNSIGSCTTSEIPQGGGTCVIEWNTTGLVTSTYTMIASVISQAQCVSYPVMITLLQTCALVNITPDKISANVGESIVFNINVDPISQTFNVQLADQDNNSIGNACTTLNGICTITWDTTGFVSKSYIITAKVIDGAAGQCISTPISITLQSPPSGGGVAILGLVGIASLGMIITAKPKIPK